MTASPAKTSHSGRPTDKGGRLWRWLLTSMVVMLLSVAVPTAIPVHAQVTDCSAYDSQIWAQSVYDTNPTQYAALDPDGNGLACEHLAPGAAPALWTHTIPAMRCQPSS